nr:hypothetical protein Iba_chr09cCG9690 [Ipomoea batatas]GMD35995.1 hypothetical protein Iba_chr09dCG12200 [Ipomoea batatas]GMD79858.1 hypothetical protein Iba_chr13dCG8000 [Ipomoea batatas]
MELSKLCWWKFPAIDLSAISDIDNSFTFARNSDAISTLGIIGFIFSAMVIFMRFKHILLDLIHCSWYSFSSCELLSVRAAGSFVFKERSSPVKPK